MIKLQVVDHDRQRFTVTFGRPGTIEVYVVGGKVVAHVYEGVGPAVGSPPLGSYDGVAGNAASWVSERPAVDAQRAALCRRVLDVLRNGRRLDAIKEVRGGLIRTGLAEAKVLVDRILPAGDNLLGRADQLTLADVEAVLGKV